MSHDRKTALYVLSLHFKIEAICNVQIMEKDNNKKQAFLRVILHLTLGKRIPGQRCKCNACTGPS